MDETVAWVCPECGWRVGATPPARWAVRHRAALLAVTLALGLLVYAWVQWRTWPPPGAPTLVGAGAGSHEFPRERFSPADIAAYASGARADGRLVRALRLDDPTGTLGLDVGFVEPGGTATTFRRYGWPTPVVTYRWDGTYEDVYARSGLISQPAASGPRWSSRSYITQRILPDGRRESRVVAFWGALAPVLLVAVAWFTGCLVRRYARRRRGMGRWLPAGCAALMGAVVVWLSLQGVDDADPMWPNAAPTLAPRGPTVGDVVRLAGTPRGEAELAAMFMPLANDAAANEVLVIGVHEREAAWQSWNQGGWPKGLVMDSRIEPAGARADLDELRRMTLDEGSLVLVFTDTSGGLGRRHVSISLSVLAVGISALVLVVAAVGWGLRGVSRIDRVRWRRRIARGLCAQCGYDVGCQRGGVTRTP